MFIQPNRDHPDHEGADRSPAVHVPDRIPLFPLPNVVFFPRTYLPLHIFEPRYREMVLDAATSGRCIGMALLKEGWETQYQQNPPIFSMGCVGRLASLQRLPDGRSNILLQGIERYEVREEFFEKPYREATVTLKSRSEDQGPLDPALRTHVLDLAQDYMRTSEAGSLLQVFARQDLGDDVLINSLSGALDCTPLEKQFLLEADTLYHQARRLCDLIQFKLLEHRGGKGWG